tara:strand:- start:587 stop:793 length:207 start_codon:yes stop_codon:yes gene_type:complete
MSRLLSIQKAYKKKLAKLIKSENKRAKDYAESAEAYLKISNEDLAIAQECAQKVYEAQKALLEVDGDI